MSRVLAAIALSASMLLAAVAPAQDLAIRAGRLHTMAAAGVIENAVVIVRDGKIAAAGAAADVPIPAGMRILEAAVLTPGLIDARATAGLGGTLNQTHDQEQQEPGDPIQPELRAMDAFNAREPLVAWLREHGVTTLHAAHAPGALVGGTSFVVKTREAPFEETVLLPEAMVVASLADGARGKGEKGPGTKARFQALLRQKLVEAGEYRAKRASADPEKRPPRDLRQDALVAVLDGSRPMLITAHRDRDIRSAMRLATEFGFRLILDGGAEIHGMLDAVAAARIPVIIHPTMARTSDELENLSMRTAARLAASDIPFAFQSGFESYVPKTRVVLFEAAQAAAAGLEPARALRAMTADAAKLLGVDARVGSIEAGKDGDLALFDGDPFEWTTHVVAVVIDGRVVSERAR